MKQYFYLLAITLFFSSCAVKYKTIPYFQDVPATGLTQEEIKNYTTLKIQSDDILAITVSSLNEKASAIYNFGNTSSINPNASSNANITQANASNGFLVDQNGNIQMPVLGDIKVAGLSTIEARNLIQKKLAADSLLLQPVVSLRLVNFKVSVIGDVARPGVFPLQNERTTVIDALSLAGDLNITALRNNILLIREVNNKRETIRLDLNSKELFNSPYYYMQNNDVIYVVPSNAKYASVDTNYRNVGILLSALSILVVIISRL